MPDPHGMPIWYELVSADADASAAFYDAVVGWTTGPRPEGDMDYRMIAAADGSMTGGLAQIADAAPVQLAPGWRFYVGVDDVDAAVARIVAAGGSVTLPAFDLPEVGRMALVADPQGIGFYVMRGAGGEDSTAFGRTTPGKCSWNELATPDQAAANAFFAEVFGWTYPDRMTMLGMGHYVFVAVGGDVIGATMAAVPGGPPPGWRFYFRVADIERAAATVAARGGTVLMGPHEVPGGERIIVASDPQGTMFGIVAPGPAA